MLIKPFTSLLKDKKDPTTMSYLGMVEDNNDPEKLGRIRVRIDPYTDLMTEDIPWASPMLGSSGNSPSNGGLNIPELGSQVRIVFPSRDFTAPYYTGAELTSKNKTTFFDDDYPNVYGYRDSNGNFIRVNKASGLVHMQHESTSNVQFTPDGSMQVSLRNGASFTITSLNSFDLSVSGVNFTGTPDGTARLQANTEIQLEAESVDINSGNVSISGDLSVGSGASGMIWALNGIVTVKNGIITSIKNG